MVHREQIRIVPGARNAVLFIHGIVGTPNHFVTQIPLLELVPENWSVYNLLLDGHGGSVTDFSHTSMKKWKNQVWRIFRELAETHEHIVIAAHSMGTLFAMQLALENPGKVAQLFLIAVPMRPWVRLFGAVNCLRLVFGKIREDHPFEVATRNVCGVVTTRRLWRYLGWVPRFLELFAEIVRTEEKMGKLQTPCMAFQSKKDELVSNRSRSILERSGVMQIIDLHESSHFYYAPDDREIVREYFINCIKKHD